MQYLLFPLHLCVTLCNIKLGHQEQINNYTSVTLNQFPFMVSLELLKSSERTFCSGSLIKSNVVLTSAHCLQKNVYLYRYTVAEVSNGKILKAQLSKWYLRPRFYPHPYFNPKDVEDKYSYDIGLIYLLHNVSTERAQLIKLANKYENDKSSVGNVIGYGVNINAEGELIPELRSVTVSIPEKGFCDRYRDHPIFNMPFIICAFGNSQRMCMGDSGGPLMRFENNTPVIIAVNSFVFDTYCSQSNMPQAYVSVASHLEWINGDHLSPNYTFPTKPSRLHENSCSRYYPYFPYFLIICIQVILLNVSVCI